METRKKTECVIRKEYLREQSEILISAIKSFLDEKKSGLAKSTRKGIDREFTKFEKDIHSLLPKGGRDLNRSALEDFLASYLGKVDALITAIATYRQVENLRDIKNMYCEMRERIFEFFDEGYQHVVASNPKFLDQEIQKVLVLSSAAAQKLIELKNKMLELKESLIETGDVDEELAIVTERVAIRDKIIKLDKILSDLDEKLQPLVLQNIENRYPPVLESPYSASDRARIALEEENYFRAFNAAMDLFWIEEDGREEDDDDVALYRSLVTDFLALGDEEKAREILLEIEPEELHSKNARKEYLLSIVSFAIKKKDQFLVGRMMKELTDKMGGNEIIIEIAHMAGLYLGNAELAKNLINALQSEGKDEAVASLSENLEDADLPRFRPTMTSSLIRRDFLCGRWEDGIRRYQDLVEEGLFDQLSENEKAYLNDGIRKRIKSAGDLYEFQWALGGVSLDSLIVVREEFPVIIKSATEATVALPDAI